MKTRRSPRNQEILWRELGGKQPKVPKIDPIVAIEHALTQPFLSPRTRRMLERDLARAKQRAAIAKAIKENRHGQI